MSKQELELLCAELRHFLIDQVSKTGGHLSSNLGTVELTVALFYAFDFDRDVVVWDVGHQSYTYKILTDRFSRFDTLRQKGGISGFPAPSESKYDAFIAGHGNTSLSAAIGIARAKKIKNEPGYVIVVIGDGAFTGGMVYEGFNNIDDTLDNLIVVLNDNKMSISKNVGSVARYLTSLRTSPGYSHAKKTVEDILGKTPLIGKPLRNTIVASKSLVRRAVYSSTFFEDLGLQYIGTMDGNNIYELADLFRNIQLKKGPMIIHLETVKGKGYKPAEENPGAFHGVSAFDYLHLDDPDNAPSDSFSNVFGQNLVELAQNNSSICAITAAMKYGTGLQFFYKAFKERFFDVGMAEQHAVTFSAGLASRGLLPVVAIYSTFLQRAYDSIIHDVVLQNLNVLFAIDRAGLVPGDGETHQGIYDVAFLSEVQSFVIMAPCNYAELTYWLEKLLNDYSMPRAIRYPRGGESPLLHSFPCTGNLYDKIFSAPEADTACVTYGREASEVYKACELAGADGYKLLQINPLPASLAQTLLPYKKIVFAEEGVENGGVGQRLYCALAEKGYQGHYEIIAVPNHGIDHCPVEELLCDFGLDTASLTEKLKKGASAF